MKQFGNFQAPENWGEITIGQLIRLQAIDKFGETTESTIKAVGVFNPETNALSCDFGDLISTATQIFGVIRETPQNAQKCDSYTIDGQKFKIMNAEEINVAEFNDVNALNENESERIKNMPLMISILTRDKGKHADTKAWAEKIQENVSVLTGIGILVFFSENLMRYLKSTPYYSQIIKAMEKNEKKV